MKVIGKSAEEMLHEIFGIKTRNLTKEEEIAADRAISSLGVVEERDIFNQSIDDLARRAEKAAEDSLKSVRWHFEACSKPLLQGVAKEIKHKSYDISTKAGRVEIVNRLIEEIANRSHRTFYDKGSGRIAKFILRKRNVLWYVDHFIGESNPVYAHKAIHSDKVVVGGTMTALLNDFREFICLGIPTDGDNGYGGLECRYWAYPDEDVKAIQALAKELGYIKGV